MAVAVVETASSDVSSSVSSSVTCGWGRPVEGAAGVLAHINCMLGLCRFCCLSSELSFTALSQDARWVPGLQNVAHGLAQEAPSMQPNLECSLYASSSIEFRCKVFIENLLGTVKA